MPVRRAVAAGTTHTVGLRVDGTVVATGGNSHGQLEVDSWRLG
ncbi:RCC1 domain-containing protein [Arachnia propionica]